MLCFHVTENKSIQIDLDHEGVQKLISVLEEFNSNRTGHIHLRAPSAGGSALSDTTPWGAHAVGEVIITLGGDD